MTFQTESQLEAHIRRLICDQVTAHDKSVYALESKKAVDIIVCKDSRGPELFFIEVKFHKPSHGRLGFGGGKGGGFQPEIMMRKPPYFEKNLRWALASETHQPGRVLFLPSATLRKYVAGGKVEAKFNNIQEKLFREQQGLTEQEFARELRRWFGAKEAPSRSRQVRRRKRSNSALG